MHQIEECSALPKLLSRIIPSFSLKKTSKKTVGSAMSINLIMRLGDSI